MLQRELRGIICNQWPTHLTISTKLYSSPAWSSLNLTEWRIWRLLVHSLARHLWRRLKHRLRFLIPILAVHVAVDDVDDGASGIVRKDPQVQNGAK